MTILVNIHDLISMVIAKDIHLFPSINFCLQIENVEVFKNWFLNDNGLVIKKTKPIMLIPPVSASLQICFSVLSQHIPVEKCNIEWVDISF